MEFIEKMIECYWIAIILLGRLLPIATTVLTVLYIDYKTFKVWGKIKKHIKKIANYLDSIAY